MHIENNDIDINSYTPLIYASSWGNLDIVKLLIERGADINQVDKNGNGPLMPAIYFKKLDVVELLIKKGADVNQVNKNGKTPLNYAISNKSLPIDDQIIQLLSTASGSGGFKKYLKYKEKYLQLKNQLN